MLEDPKVCSTVVSALVGSIFYEHFFLILFYRKSLKIPTEINKSNAVQKERKKTQRL